MEDAFIRKKQPYNLDAEQSVIGSMIMDRDAIVDVSDILTKEDFTVRRMQSCMKI